MKNQKRLTVAASMAVVALLGGAIFGGTADAKKKGGGGGKPVTVSNNTPTPIPEATLGQIDAGPPAVLGTVAWGKASKTLKVKGKKSATIGNVAITFSAATGGGGTDTLQEFLLRLTAPDGTTEEIVGGLSGIAAGPLTVQPNSPNELCRGETAPNTPPPPPCADPNAIVNPPFQGVVGDPDLRDFNGGKMKGTWTVSAFDTRAANPNPPAPEPVQTNILNGVTLKVTPAKTA